MRNLTEVSLRHKSLVWYFIVVIALGGIFAFRNLGRMEDPAFTIRQMIVMVAWPGATAEEMAEFVADPLEKKLQDTPGLDYLNSECRPGEVRVFVNLRDEVPNDKIRETWQAVRHFSADAKQDLPQDIVGPYFNDRFDDVFGSIYAVTGDDYTYEELRIEAEKFRRRVLEIPSVQKVELDGVQDEKIYIEFSSDVISNLGISVENLQNAISSENSRLPTGDVMTEGDHVFVRYSGTFADVESLRTLSIPINGKLLQLRDIAKISLRSEEPSAAKMYFNGKKAIGVKISMAPGGNVILLGQQLEKAEEEFKNELPLGMELNMVADQPQVVEESIGEFTKTLFEAIVIVLLVSFCSLGIRTGLVVAFSIPLVLAAVFLFMYVTGIDLHKISLGALIIALGLLVDDAIIAVEMMSVKLEEGLSKFDAACYAFKETAMPMLTGTLITTSGFIPVAFAKGLASEFCAALFPVIGAALVTSWVVSVMVAPFFGTYLIKVKKEEGENKSAESRFYFYFRKLLSVFLAAPKVTITVTIIIFVMSVYGMKFVRQEFFPPSIRPELLIDITLSRGTSNEETDRVARKLADYVDKLDGVDHYTYYVGEGAPRFVLTANPTLPDDNFAQFVIVGKTTEAREKIQAELSKILKEEFYFAKTKMHLIQTGPPAKAPVMLRVSGNNFNDVKQASQMIMTFMNDNKLAKDVVTDANEEGRILKLDLDQGRLAALGVTRGHVSRTLYGYLDGMKVAEYYHHGKTIPIEVRSVVNERDDLLRLQNLPIMLSSGQKVPLSQIGKLKLETEPMFIPRRNLKETITIMGELPPEFNTANDATANALKRIEEANLDLPEGTEIVPGGSLEDSNKSTDKLLVPIPAMLFVIMTLLMFQLGSIKDMILVLLTAPMGLIGVASGMLISDSALGFVAQLGILALSGMIMRNSVILIDQIHKRIAAGEKPYVAIIDSAVMRFRPIMLTAAAAILGMIPLMASNFWNPMAVAIAAGLLVATALTLLVLPAMFMVAYGIKQS